MAMSIRIAMIIPSLVVGGAENMVAQLVENINRKKYDILLIVLSKNNNTYIDNLMEHLSIKVLYMNKKKGFSIRALLKVFNALSKFKPHIIHTHLSSWIYASIWAIVKGVKVLHTIHTMPIRECTGVARILRGLLYRKRYIIPVAISDIIARQTIELYNIVADYIEIIYNPVDVKKYKAKSRHIHEDITFVNIARFTKIKNQKLLVEAFYEVHKRLPNSHLILVGDGELRKQIEEKVLELDLKEHVTFTGIVSDVSKILIKSDIFVLPSIYEGLPLTLLEAMASGLPIIASSVGGVPDIVKDNGILVEPGKKDELISAMLKLANDIDMRKRMGKNAIEEVQKYDIAKVTRKYEKLYEKYEKS